MKKITLFIVLSGLLVHCGAEQDEPVRVEKNDVYVAGYVGAYATYWKNSVPVTLGGGPNSSLSATGIYVSDKDDVFVSCSRSNEITYWKNGEKIILPMPAGGVFGQTNDILVANNDVYACGEYSTTSNMKPFYFRNSERVDLQIPHPFTNGSGRKITVDGSDVYVIGYVRTWNTSQTTVALWKNGVFIPLPVPNNYNVSFANGVKVSEGHVYVSGYIRNIPYTVNGLISLRAVYWKDGIMQFIGTSEHSIGHALDVKNGNVYIPYFVYDGSQTKPQHVKYLKNDEEITVDKGAQAIIYQLFVSGDAVYIAGTFRETNGDEALATYWVNGKRIQLSTQESQAVSCFVKESKY